MGSNEHQQLGPGIAEALRRRILEGEISPGEWLRQERIAREFEVSQMPVREALRQLVAEGLVEHLPYRGIRVVEVSIEDAEDLFFCRVSIEGRAAGFAAQNMTWKELETLVNIREMITKAIELGEIVEYQELNRNFHNRIIQASRHPLLIRSLSGLWATYPSMLWPSFRDRTADILGHRFKEDEAEHDAILESLKRRDPREAEETMRFHIQNSARSLLATAQEEED